MSLGKHRALDRELNHVTFLLSISVGEENEDAVPGQIWLTLPALKQKAMQVIIFSSALVDHCSTLICVC